MTTAGVVILYLLLTAAIAGIAVVIALLMRESSPPQAKIERVSVDLLTEIDERLQRFELLLNEASRTRARLDELAKEIRAQDTQTVLYDSDARIVRTDASTLDRREGEPTETSKVLPDVLPTTASLSNRDESMILAKPDANIAGDRPEKSLHLGESAGGAAVAAPKRELNERELRIYGYLKEGKSVAEIAREMGMWKGEVELISALLATTRKNGGEKN